MSTESSILVGCFGDAAWILVRGMGTHQNSATVRDFSRERIDSGGRLFVVDLGECQGIDSTFIGTLTAISIELSEKGTEEGVEVINANERIVQSICKLGLDCLVKIDKEGVRWQSERELVMQNVKKAAPEKPVDPKERATLMLAAHEALVAANESNYCEFRDVLEYLKKDIQSDDS